MFDWDNMRIKKRTPDDWHASPFENPREKVLGVMVKKKYTKNER